MPKGPRITVHTRPEWMDEGSCKGKTNLFHPRNIIEQERAIRICQNDCPVMDQCDEYATVHREKDGVWGGKMRGSLFYPERKRGCPPKNKCEV